MWGYVGEVFSSIQGEGIHLGCRQVFVRLAGCPLHCVYCDTVRFRSPVRRWCVVECRPGSQEFKKVKNPVETSRVVEWVRELWTSATHSVALTGGEPLAAGEFLVELTRALKQRGFRNYLETSGVSSPVFERVAEHIDFAAIDIKLPEHRAVERWGELLKYELGCVRLALKHRVDTFVKLVVLESTEASTVIRVCRRLKRIGRVPVVLQPVTPRRGMKRPSWEQLLKITEEVARLGLDVRVIPQVHRLGGWK